MRLLLDGHVLLRCFLQVAEVWQRIDGLLTEMGAPSRPLGIGTAVGTARSTVHRWP